MKAYAYFKELPIKTEFSLNGNRYVKQSTKTARLVEYGKTFYFLRGELCVVGVYSRLGAGYVS